MSNKYWDNIRTYIAGTKARGNIVDDDLDGITAGFELVEVDTTRSIKLSSTSTDLVITENATNRKLKGVGFDINGDLSLITLTALDGSPTITSGDANGVVVVNAGETGYEITQGFKSPAVASAVNYIEAFGAVTLGEPVVQSAGSDTNINLQIKSKGTGIIKFLIRDDVQFGIDSPTTAVNYLSVSGANIGTGPSVNAVGIETDIDIRLRPKGTGVVDILNGFSVDGTPVTATPAELNKLDGVTANTTEINYNDIISLGTVEASKTVTADANKDIAGIRYIDFGGQLKFPATQAASSDANTLDDYEEGTWTPVLSDGTNDATNSIEVGFYRKIGDMVFIKCYIQTSALGSVSGSARIKGLPFVSNSTTNSNSSISSGYGQNLNITGTTNIGGYVEPGQSYLLLRNWDSTAGTTALQATEWTASGRAMFGGWYTT